MCRLDDVRLESRAKVRWLSKEPRAGPAAPDAREIVIAMPGKRKSDDDFPEFNDEALDGQNDGLADEMNQENGEDDPSAGKAKWVDPTHEEISGYRQAEQLFKSSLLQLQIAELRGEVNVDYAKLSGLEEVC